MLEHSDVAAGIPAQDLELRNPSMREKVDDIQTTVAALRARGVVFEEYDLPGLKTIDGIAEVPAIIRAVGEAVNGRY